MMEIYSENTDKVLPKETLKEFLSSFENIEENLEEARFAHPPFGREDHGDEVSFLLSKPYGFNCADLKYGDYNNLISHCSSGIYDMEVFVFFLPAILCGNAFDDEFHNTLFAKAIIKAAKHPLYNQYLRKPVANFFRQIETNLGDWMENPTHYGVNMESFEKAIAEKPSEGFRDWTAIHKATISGDASAVASLLAKRIGANGKGPNGRTPLHLAAFWGYKDISTLLVSFGAIVDAKDKRGYTPLHLASFWGSREVVEILIENGADISLTVGNQKWMPLHWAAGRVTTT